MHAAAVTKPHFGLGRVHVDVHLVRGQLQVQHIGGVAAVIEHVLVGQARCVREQPVAHQAAVDVPVLQVGGGAREGRQRRPAGQAQVTGREIQPQRRLDETRPAQARQALFAYGAVARRRQLLHGAAVVRPAEADVEAGQRQPAQHLVGMLIFGLFGAQEAPACRQVVEQVAHRHGGARRMGGRQRRVMAGRQLRRVAAGHRRHDVQARHRGDAGQGLAAKAEGLDAHQLGAAGELAGGVAAQRQRQLAGRDAAAVVADADQVDAAAFQGHVDVAGAGIEGVFQQLLDDRGRSLDDLAGGDLVGQLRRQLADRPSRRLSHRHRGGAAPACGRPRHWPVPGAGVVRSAGSREHRPPAHWPGADGTWDRTACGPLRAWK